MKTRKYNHGLSLVEMLIVIGVIALLATMVIGVASRIDNQAKEKLARSTVAILDGALGQFHDYGYTYKNPIYAEFDFPLDVIEPALGPLSPDVLITTLTQEFGLAVSVEPVYTGEPIFHNLEYTSCELLYFFLSRIPECREILDKIDGSLITDKDDNGYRMKLRIGNSDYPLLRIIDPWGKTLIYDYSNEITRRTFPIITSAGPDGNFGTDDDITNK
jgi:prepilin-type N-terminal cleavage/methylation domain-containing protein